MATDLILIPLTLTDAVNTLLRAVGLTEVDSLLDSDMNKDSQNAFQAINRANASVQAEGWHCNTEEEFPISPDEFGSINIPPTFLTVRPDRRHETWFANKHITTRGGRLYNLTDHTFVFTDQVFLVIVQALAFEDLPPALRWLITCVAGRAFAEGTYPSSGAMRFTADEEVSARSKADQEDGVLRDQTLPETSPYFQWQRRR